MYVLGTAKYFLAVIECNRSPSLFGVDNAVLSRLTKICQALQRSCSRLESVSHLILGDCTFPIAEPFAMLSSKKVKKLTSKQQGQLALGFSSKRV